MERTVEQLKERIRAGGAKIPAEKVIENGQLVNVMTSEIYPAEIAIYKDMIAAVGDEAEVADYIETRLQIIDAKGRFLRAKGMIDGHIHSECSKLSITSYAKAVVPRGTSQYDLRPSMNALPYHGSGWPAGDLCRSKEKSVESILGRTV